MFTYSETATNVKKKKIKSHFYVQIMEEIKKIKINIALSNVSIQC